MSTILVIFLSAFTGTSLMTLFSYLLTNVFDKQFKEPVLLQKLLNRSRWLGGMPMITAAGWVLHYSAGVVFVIFYHILWSNTTVQPAFWTGSILGMVSGLIGGGVWFSIFKIHRDPPSIDRSGFFLHLIIVHIAFGIGATAAYQIFMGL